MTPQSTHPVQVDDLISRHLARDHGLGVELPTGFNNALERYISFEEAEVLVGLLRAADLDSYVRKQRVSYYAFKLALHRGYADFGFERIVFADLVKRDPPVEGAVLLQSWRGPNDDSLAVSTYEWLLPDGSRQIAAAAPTRSVPDGLEHLVYDETPPPPPTAEQRAAIGRAWVAKPDGGVLTPARSLCEWAFAGHTPQAISAEFAPGKRPVLAGGAGT